MKIHMTGGSPWGFKMTGGRDFRQPLAIGKVTAGSKADRAGVVEGHHILTVNGEDVTNLAHLDAQNKIKAAKTTLTLELSNAPVPVPKPTEAQTAALNTAYVPPPQNSYTATSPSANKSYSATSNYSASNKGYSAAPPSKPTYNSSYNVSLQSKSPTSPTRISSAPRSPTYTPSHNKQPSMEDKNATPDIEYRPVDSRDSYRRLYEESQDSEWQPTAHQSTLQSPSMKALAMSSGSYERSNVSDEDKPKLIVTEEIRDMILEAETDKHNGHSNNPSVQDAALRPTGIKVYDPRQNYSNKPVNSSSPAPYSSGSSNFTQPANHSSQSSYGSQSSTGSGPTYSSQPQPAKSKAVGNISKFLQSSGAKQGRPEFAKTLADLQCPYGDPAVLEIRIGNTLPVPTVAWYHNDRPIRESKEKDIKFLSKGIVHTLVLGEFGPEFRGRYKCVLTNKHGSISCSSILAEEQPQANNGGYAPAPTSSPYSNKSNRGGYQPSYTSTYQAPVNNQRTTKPMPSISVGLYSQNAANEAYNAQTRKQAAREEPEESDVMRALREEGQVGDDKPQYQSRSMRMLNETLMPESDDL